jgi:hypothetical protein
VRAQRDDGRSAYSRVVNAEFNWWLLIVGLVVGAGLVWLVVADSRRREADVGELERQGEAQWIAATMSDAGRRVDEADVLDILRLHGAYLAAAPPDEPDASADGWPDHDDVPPAADDGRWVEVRGRPDAAEPTISPR